MVKQSLVALFIVASLLLFPDCAAKRDVEDAEARPAWHSMAYPPDHIFVLSAVKDLPEGTEPSVDCPPWHWSSGSIDPSLPFVFSCILSPLHGGEDEKLQRWRNRANSLCYAFNDLIDPRNVAFSAAARRIWEDANDQFAARYFHLGRMPTSPEVEAFALHYFLQAGLLERMSALANETVPFAIRMPDEQLLPWLVDPSLEEHLDVLSFARRDDPRKYAGFIQTTETLCTGLFRLWEGELITPTFGFPQLEACLAAHQRLMKENTYASAFAGLTDPIREQARKLQTEHMQEQPGDDAPVNEPAMFASAYRETRRALSHRLYVTLEASNVPRRIGIESCNDWPQESDRADCLSGLALFTRDAAYCTAIESQSRREACAAAAGG